MALYVALGLIGVPVFTQGGGPGYIFQPTFDAPNTSREAGSPLAVHADWIDGLIKKYGTGLKREKAEAVLRDEIGIVFSHVLENAGVFKQDAAGQAAFLKFMESVGYRKA